jgi:ketopantoate reductase
MQHGILGAGGVGVLVAAVLARTGATVNLIIRPEAVEHDPREIVLSSRAAGTFSVAVSVTSKLFQPCRRAVDHGKSDRSVHCA